MTASATGSWTRRGHAIVLDAPDAKAADVAFELAAAPLTDVKWVQAALNVLLGRGLVEDGVAGTQTRSALRDFQGAHGLVADGAVGPLTASALQEALLSLPTGGQPCMNVGRPAEELVGFAFDDARLQPAHLVQIGKLARCAAATRPPSVRIVGHTDPVGDDAYNLTLGLHRAEQVTRAFKQALDRLSPGATTAMHIEVDTRGEAEQIPGSQELNRRVQVFVPLAAPPRRAPASRPPRVPPIVSVQFPPTPPALPPSGPPPATQAASDPWATADSTRNILLFPVPVRRTRVGPLAALEGGLVTDASLRARVSAVVGPGATPRGIGEVLAPLYASADPRGAPGAVEIARAVLFYNRLFLPLPDARAYRDGLRIPLPIEVDQTSGEWILNPQLVRLWSRSLDPAAAPLLDRRPTHLALPDQAVVAREVATFLGGQPRALERGVSLLARVLTNPFEAVFFLFETFKQLGNAGFDTALEFCNSAVRHQIELLASLTAGRAILMRLDRVFSTAPGQLPPARAAALDRARRMIGPALVPPVGIVPARELPETPQQLAKRKGAVAAKADQPAEPPGGLHRIVLGRDVSVGAVGSLIKGFLGAGSFGRLSPRTFIAANIGRLNPTNDAGLNARLEIVRAIAVNEGRLDAAQMQDSGIISVGLQQWTAPNELELPALLFRFRVAEPDEFALFFRLYRLDVRPAGQDPNGNPRFRLQRILPNGTAQDLAKQDVAGFFEGTKAKGVTTFKSDWVARSRLAALASQIFRETEILEACARFERAVRDAGTIKVSGTQMSLNQLLTSKFGVALVLDQHINRPGFVHQDLQQAVNATKGPFGPSRQRAIVKKYAQIRRTFNTPTRNKNIVDQNLDEAPGSFVGW